MAKRGLKAERKHLYAPPSGEVVLVEVPAMSFLMLDGADYPKTALAN